MKLSTKLSTAALTAGALAAPFFLPRVLAQDGEVPAKPGARILVQVRPAEVGLDEFDAARWTSALRSDDLDERERSFDDLVRLARGNQAARDWLESAAIDGDRELAWSARLALRELGRERDRTPLSIFHSGSGDLDELERRIEEFTERFAPGWNHRVDPLLVPFPGVFRARPVFPGAGSAAGKSINIQNGDGGWKIKITEQEDGEETVREYEGATLDEILEAHPELKDEVNVSGAIVGPGLSLKIRSQDGTFDFDKLFEEFGVQGPSESRRPWRLRFRPAAPVRTDILGVFVHALEGGEGLEVKSVAPGTIAQLLGLGAGDVLFELNGSTLSTEMDITAAMGAREEGAPVVVVWRDGLGRRHSATWRSAKD